jgi:hypothetical protein
MHGKTLLLAGPFKTVQEAEFCIDLCGPLLIAEEPTSVHASFGVVEFNRPDGLGVYNRALRANGVNVPVPAN